MRKIAVLVLSAFMFVSCGAMYSARPAEAMMGGDWEVGAWCGEAIWGTIKGCYKAWNAPKGRKWESFKEGYKEGTEGVECTASRGLGGIIAK